MRRNRQRLLQRGVSGAVRERPGWLPAAGLRKDRILLRIAALETGFANPDPAQLEQLRRLINLSGAAPVNRLPADD